MRHSTNVDTGDGASARPTPHDRRPARASRARSLAKTLSWRVVATLTTFVIAWIVTGNVAAGAAIGSFEAAAKMVLYYGHERAWEAAG